MSVVTDVGMNVDDDEPTWDEAAAAFDAATSVELKRSPRQVTVVYRYADGVFTATSAELGGFRITGRGLTEVKSLVRDALEGFLDPAIKVLEREPAAGLENCTASAGRVLFFRASPPPGIVVPSSSGTARTFFSPARVFAIPREVRTS